MNFFMRFYVIRFIPQPDTFDANSSSLIEEQVDIYLLLLMLSILRY